MPDAADVKPERFVRPPSAESEGRAPGRGRLKGRRILIVGGGQRIFDAATDPVGNGRAMSLLCAREGAHVAVADINKTSADHTVSQITTEGGFFPAWSPSGSQLFYTSPQRDKLFSVDVQTGASFSFSKSSPVPLPPGVLLGTTSARNYDIAPDGKQFVVVIPVPQPAPAQRSNQQVELVQNWLEELKLRLTIK